jgi:hypothetical protein
MDMSQSMESNTVDNLLDLYAKAHKPDGWNFS